VKLDPAPPESSPSASRDGAKHRGITYRVSQIPENYDGGSLHDALCTSFHLEQRTGVKIHSFAADVSSPSRRRVATVSFRSEPLRLSSHGPSEGHEEPIEWRLDLVHPTSRHTDSVLIDTHFKGFTPLSPLVRDEEHVIE